MYLKKFPSGIATETVKIWKVLKYAQHFWGRKNCYYRSAIRVVTRAFVKCTKVQRLKKRNMRSLLINQITADFQEHGLKYPVFTVNLIVRWSSIGKYLQI
uniref:Uncharacterized protein n=1 Tax=Prolemur simus TaxID=1328070 RepID=A0A8C8Z940_PROSS